MEGNPELIEFQFSQIIDVKKTDWGWLVEMHIKVAVDLELMGIPYIGESLELAVAFAIDYHLYGWLKLEVLAGEKAWVHVLEMFACFRRGRKWGGENLYLIWSWWNLIGKTEGLNQNIKWAIDIFLGDLLSIDCDLVFGCCTLEVKGWQVEGLSLPEL